VILPDHLHCIWTLPEGDEATTKRWRVIKFWFSSHCASSLRPNGEGLWSGRFHEHPIRSASDYQHHVDFIHYDVVKHGVAARPAEWPYSSFGRYVQMGWLHPQWGEPAPAIPEWVGYE
jgi:putative transposase